MLALCTRFLVHTRNVYIPTVQFLACVAGLFVAFDDDDGLDDFNEDYDEFLDNDNALEMERWQMS